MFEAVDLVSTRLDIGRGEMIRTSDPLHPMQVRYQAALRPDRTLNFNIRPLANRPKPVCERALGLEDTQDLGEFFAQTG